MGQVIVFTSGKGGVGKTTTTANIGISLALLGKKILLIDSDIGLRNLDVILGLENKILYNLVDVINGVCRLKQAIIKDKRAEGMYLLPAAQTNLKTDVTPSQMIKLCNDLRDDYDFVLIDCPAGIEQGFKNAVAAADKAIIIANPEISSIRDADRIVGLLEDLGIMDQHLIVNRARPDMMRRGDMITVEDMVDILGLELLGVVPDDEKIIEASNRGQPIVLQPGSAAGQAYRRIASRLNGQEIPIPKLEDHTGFYGKIKRMLGA